MALLFIDSFDHYTDAGDKYTIAGSNASSFVPGRHGKGFSRPALEVGLNPTGTRCIAGAAWRILYHAGYLYSLNMTSNLNDLFTVAYTRDGALEISLLGADGFGDTEVVARSPADVVKLNNWYYIEFDVTFSQDPATWRITADICKVYVDGAIVIDEVNLGPSDNQVTLAAQVPSIWNRFMVGGQVQNDIVDDLYVCDGSGPAPWNAPLGDVQIDVIRPNGVGASTQWLPVGMANNWANVRDLTPDDDATKVVAATAGLTDLYQMEDINTNNGIIGAQLLIASRRTEESFATLVPLLRHAGTTYPLAPRAISPSYQYRNREVFVTMPNGDPLTDANVNALQAGYTRGA